MLKRNKSLSIRPANMNDGDFVIDAIHDIVRICLDKTNIPLIPDDLANSLWRNMIENPKDYHCLIAESEGKKVGTAVLGFHQSLNHLGPICELQDLYVNSDARGTGAGARLLERVEKEAEERGCVAIELLMPDPGTPLDKERNEFYERKGYKLEGLSRYKPLRTTLYK
ncbi:acetyltransferase, GNAT family protein [Tritrichomonas foetus]|uniref:Acetyltransferase, GNAT family protein n=1 Tax=Tritrichomonas foetus TaxID=1144522 RepID=A0A1J4JFU9_9EUKA|nr:acetyltransferase, GNAT family protein [Tritrichomonas foetus]|eukprot:OHS96341.1 acetyltransferase, GNAT family protein [Tritrichomonas foetus]